MKKLIYLAISVFLLAGLNTSKAFADQNCQPIYGGGETCANVPQISINKFVKNPSTGDFVNNLGASDPKFSENQIVPFKLTVKNPTNSTISNITVKDLFPSFVNFVDGTGSFDKNNNTLTFTIDSLKANESRDFIVDAKVVTASSLPSDKDIVCVVNQATAKVSDNTSTDNAQFCIQNKVLGTTKGGLTVFPPTTVKSTPSTGPEALAIFGLLPAGLSGFLLRNKSNKLKNKGVNTI